MTDRDDVDVGGLPPQAPDPVPCGTHTVRLPRTYPNPPRAPDAPDLSAAERTVATPLHHVLVDPDGRPFGLRRRNTF